MTLPLLIAALLSSPLIPEPWKNVSPGVQVAAAAELGGDPSWAARAVLIDPARVTFLVRYDSGRPTLADWRKRFPEALAIANGSFYSLDGPPGAEVRPTCDLVVAGKAIRGAGCKRQDALFFGASPRMESVVPTAALSPRELKAPPQPRLLLPADFRPEQWTEALKSFPALVHAGAACCAGPHYCAESSRTAAVAQLKDGRILLFASQWPAVRREVAKWLAEEVGAAEALNLDGGPEATLALKGELPEDSIGTQGVGLPIVLVVVAR
jgi:Phosphodiester glycosidase